MMLTTQTSLESLANELSQKDEMAWIAAGRNAALSLFREAAWRVPAYRHFLAGHGIEAAAVRSYEDFCRLPVTDKSNYINRYALEELVWDGNLSQAVVLHSSSGTNGMPNYWPNSAGEMETSAAVYELLYREFFAIQARRTLLLVCFGMGTWIAGAYTFLASQAVSRRGYDLTIMTPGFDKTEALRCLGMLAPKFEQVVIAGIPSFIKDLLDGCAVARVPFPKWIHFLLAGEGFSEAWRAHVMGLVGAESALSILGSADAGLMAFETSWTQSIRQRVAHDSSLQNRLFGRPRLPALFAYIPTNRFLEEHAGELLITAGRCLPLIRYNLHDEGGILTSSQLTSTRGLPALPRPCGATARLPLVFVHGRHKFGTPFYGLLIHPEDVQVALLQPPVAGKVSGRFTLESGHDTEHKPFLTIRAELAESADPTPELEQALADGFVALTRKSRSEYHRICQEYGAKARPHVVLHRYQDPSLFPCSTQCKTL